MKKPIKRIILLLIILLTWGGLVSISNSAFPDTDNDGILDSLDNCPQIPAKNQADGCPNFATRTPVYENLLFMTPRVLIAEKTSLDFKQKKEIRFNDEISAVLYDSKTGEIFSQSNVIKVGN
jgi:hypothetical protein